MSIETFNDLNNNLRATNIVNSWTLFTVSYHACLPGSFRGLLCEKSDERTSAKPILWRCTLTQWNHLCVTQFTAFPAKRDAATKTESFYEQQQFTIMLIIKTVQCMSPPSTLMSAHAAEPAQKHRLYKDKRLSYRSQDLTRAVRVLQELHHQSNKFQKGISLRILRRWLAISVLLWKQPITI